LAWRSAQAGFPAAVCRIAEDPDLGFRFMRSSPASAVALFFVTLMSMTFVQADPGRPKTEWINVGDYASVEASLSEAEPARAIVTPVPVTLATDNRSGALVLRTIPAVRPSRECRWPDPDSLSAVVAVVTDQGNRASGVVIAEGRVLTAAHAIADGEVPYVDIDGEVRRADVLLVDETNDVALFGVETSSIKPLPVALQGPIEHESVWAVGYPKNANKTTSSGVFQRMREGVLHTSAAIDAGQSGGGLLACADGDFRLLGMLRGFGAYRSGSGYVRLPNHSVSVAATTLRRVLDGYALSVVDSPVP